MAFGNRLDQAVLVNCVQHSLRNPQIVQRAFLGTVDPQLLQESVRLRIHGEVGRIRAAFHKPGSVGIVQGVVHVVRAGFQANGDLGSLGHEVEDDLIGILLLERAAELRLLPVVLVFGQGQGSAGGPILHIVGAGSNGFGAHAVATVLIGLLGYDQDLGHGVFELAGRLALPGKADGIVAGLFNGFHATGQSAVLVALAVVQCFVIGEDHIIGSQVIAGGIGDVVIDLYIVYGFAVLGQLLVLGPVLCKDAPEGTVVVNKHQCFIGEAQGDPAAAGGTLVIGAQRSGVRSCSNFDDLILDLLRGSSCAGGRGVGPAIAAGTCRTAGAAGCHGQCGCRDQQTGKNVFESFHLCLPFITIDFCL